MGGMEGPAIAALTVFLILLFPVVDYLRRRRPRHSHIDYLYQHSKTRPNFPM
jgi:hypothetical protein